MSMNSDNLNFESYVPVYDVIPEDWEEARGIIVEQLKMITNATNIREIGWMLDEELLSGQQFFPGTNNPQQFRSIFRKVVDFGAIIAGANTVAHGITVDVNFSLMHLYAAATDSVLLTSVPIPGPSATISMNAANLIITSATAYNRCYAVVEYIQEI